MECDTCQYGAAQWEAQLPTICRQDRENLMKFR